MNIIELKDIYGNTLDGEVYITKNKSLRYIRVPCGSGYCPICQKRRKTRAHHLIPKRMTKRKGYLGELRIRACRDCHNNLHIENKYIESLRKLLPKLLKITKGEIEKLPIYKELEELSKGQQNNSLINRKVVTKNKKVVKRDWGTKSKWKEKKVVPKKVVKRRKRSKSQWSGRRFRQSTKY